MKPISFFGSYFKEMRKQRGFTLRRFCQQNGLDPGNLSKMERGLLPPPSSKEKLEEYAKFLDLKRGSDEWLTFFDLAAASAGKIPDDVMNDSELIRKLPLVFRTLRGQRPSEEELRKLIEIIRRT